MKRIPTLDGWRAIAILAVIGHHIAASLGHESWWWRHGRMGVDVFFAVSGLLITSQLLENGNLKSFYVRRFFRILPPAVLYLAVVVVFRLADSKDVLHCLFMTRNYLTGADYTDHFWSLSVEEQFYLVWPLVLILSGKRAPRIAFAGILLVCVWRPIGLMHGVMGYARTEMRCDELLWGCIAAFVLRSGGVRLGKLVPVICVPLSIWLWANPTFLPLPPLMLAATVLSTVQNPSWAFSAVLQWKPLVWIGQRSYGLYLWQTLFILAPVSLPMPVRMSLLLLWSVVAYEFFESPLREWGRRLASSGRSANSGRLPIADEGAVTA